MSSNYFLIKKLVTEEIIRLDATEEQAAIIDLALGTSGNILINALAGAAKTSTLEFLCKYLPVQPILSLAFNKRIADEMTKRLPGHVTCRTMNSLGHRVWGSAITARPTVDKDKNYNILKDLIEALPRKQKGEAYEMFADIKRMIATAKLNGMVPDGKYPQAKRLISESDFFDSFDEEEADDLVRELVCSALTESIRQAYLGNIDFDDQIYMPTLFGGTWPRFPTVLVDEAQDLSPLNHAMLRKLVTGRLIAVGDPWQSIYAFRGAMVGGMSSLRRDFDMTEMTLSVSFRCPIEIVKRAQSRAPHMKWAENAKQGEVINLDEWDHTNIEMGAAVICRNNAPLFSLGLQLIRRGRGVQLVGFDIGPGMVRTLKKLGPEHTPQDQALALVEAWKTEKLKGKNPGAAADKAECLRVFILSGPNLGAAIAYAESLFKAQGPIFLLSGHKAKGLEWDVVYHLDPWRIPSLYARTEEEQEQELNVRYVIETRSKGKLYLMNMENMI